MNCDHEHGIEVYAKTGSGSPSIWKAKKSPSTTVIDVLWFAKSSPPMSGDKDEFRAEKRGLGSY